LNTLQFKVLFLYLTMKVKMILPALTEAENPFWRPIKYSLFPPLGLATLAAYLSPDDEIDLQDQHVEKLNIDDSPIWFIQVYITNAYRAYAKLPIIIVQKALTLFLAACM
jgi:hypothetical protein